tara:strand:- start:207 stop:656 length:450 start_codon:yes stop_codon:yes gene_type:complete
MATLKSDIYATQSATGTGDNRVDGRLLAGKVRQANATITLSDEASGNSIALVQLPTGCLIDPAQSFVQCEDPATTAFLVEIGVPSDTDALTPADLDIKDGGKVFFDTALGAPLYAVAAGDEVVSMLCNTITAITVGADVRVCITYIDYN